MSRSTGDHLLRKPLKITESENPILALMRNEKKKACMGRFSHYRYSHHHFFPQMEKQGWWIVVFQLQSFWATYRVIKSVTFGGGVKAAGLLKIFEQKNHETFACQIPHLSCFHHLAVILHSCRRNQLVQESQIQVAQQGNHKQNYDHRDTAWQQMDWKVR